MFEFVIKKKIKEYNVINYSLTFFFFFSFFLCQCLGVLEYHRVVMKGNMMQALEYKIKKKMIVAGW